MKTRINPTRSNPIVTLGAIAGLLAAGLNSAARAGSYTYTLIADNSGMFTAFNNPGLSSDAGIPSINNLGVVAFWATLDAGGSGIFRSDGITTMTMASTATVFTSFQRGWPVINDAGTVAFWGARTPAAGGGHGVFTAGFMASTVCTSTTGAYVGIVDSPSIDPSGSNVGFRADPVGGGAGVYRAAIGGGTATIATGASGLSSEGPALNSAGTAAFVGTYSGVTGVHVGAGAIVGPTTIADTAGIYSGFGTICSINSTGRVAFRANLDAGGSGIYIGGVGAAPTAFATSSFGGYSSFDTPSINSRSHVIFRAIAGGGADAIYKGPSPASHRVIGEGDVLGGKTITDVRSGRQALNDRDQFAFRVLFTDSTTAIYRANFCAADVNGDHSVDVTDLLAVIADWGLAGGGLAADVNGDGVVDVSDLLEVIARWGACPA